MASWNDGQAIGPRRPWPQSDAAQLMTVLANAENVRWDVEAQAISLCVSGADGEWTDLEFRCTSDGELIGVKAFRHSCEDSMCGCGKFLEPERHE